MKKQLLSATALVAAGAMAVGAANAATVDVGVHGYMEQVVGVVFDRDDAAGVGTGRTVPVTSFTQHSENEIHFKGTGKLDNGLEIVHDVQLEAGGSPGQYIDEQYMIIRGNFGQLILGMENNAGYLMTLGYSGSWATGVGLSMVYDRGDWVQSPAGMTRQAGGVTSVELMGPASDANAVSYFSPRFAGFQVGVSYIPNDNQQTIPGGTPLPSKATSFNEGWALGANWTGNFDNVALGVAGGYMYMNPPTGTFDAFKQWVVSASATVGPFKVAAAYNRTQDWDTSATTSNKGDVYDIGARYTFGPNAVSASYMKGDSEGTAGGGEDEDTGIVLSYARTLAPGVKVHANLLYSNFEDETGGANEFESWAFATAIRLNF